MATSVQEPRPIIPALGPFYEKSGDLAWLVVRATAGGMLLVHGITKLTTSSIAVFATNSMARRGIGMRVSVNTPLADPVIRRAAMEAARRGISREQFFAGVADQLKTGGGR